MAQTTHSISIVGDENYRNAVAIVARQKNISIGKLVRAALDAQFGAELKKAEKSLSSAANGDRENYQTKDKASTRKAKATP